MKTFRPTNGNLFKRSTTSDYFEHLNKSLREEVISMSSNAILSESENEMTETLVSKYRRECPKFDVEHYYIEREQMDVPVKYLGFQYCQSSGSEVREVFKIVVPFSGNMYDLEYCPKTFLLSGWQNYRIDWNNTIYTELFFLRNEDIKSEIERGLDAIRKMGDYLETDFNQYNESLHQFVSSLVHNRREEMRKQDDYLMTLGLPIVEKNSARRAIAIDVVKPVNSPDQLPMVTEQRMETLSDPIYQKILVTIQRIGIEMEKHPDTFRNKNEETLREHFLTSLNASFEGLSCVGEAMNAAGKTDIEIRYDNHVLFISECKIWKGKKKFDEAMEQLMSYLTWRECKVSLLYFIESEDFSVALDNMFQALVSNSRFIREVNQKDHNWRNVVVKGNSGNEVALAVQAFHFPKS